jgi:hypothetical protein
MRLLIAAAILVAGFEPHPVPQAGPAPEIARYLDEALSVIRANALTSRDVDWPAVRREVFARAATATSTAAAYPALRHALAALDDNHSFLQLSPELEAAEVRALGAGGAGVRPARGARPPSPFGTRMRPEAELLGADNTPIALVFMPQGRRDSAFAAAFQQSLAALDARRPCGWVVDLRGNGGGDMWPMLAGLGPILGEGTVGGSVNATGARDHWIYQGGEAIFEDGSGVRKTIAAVADPVSVTVASIAVLIDRGTASSGEAMAIAFRGDPRVRLFGETTFGASTATRGFKLSDGANLVVAVSTFVDRAGNVFPHGVTPDVEVAVPETRPEPSADAVLQHALTWLRTRPSCA